MLPVFRLKELHAWVPPRSRQVEKFPLDVVLCLNETTEKAGLGWAGQWTPFCQRAIGQRWTGPRHLRVTVLGKRPKLEGVPLLQRATKSQQAARGQIQTSWCQVRESVETRRPQGTHAMRSGPREVNKGVDRQAGGQLATAGSQLGSPRCGGQA